MHIQLGDLATWVGSVGTVGVLAAAVWQLGKLRRDSESEQASHISAWVSGTKLSAPDGILGLKTIVEVSLRNVSPQPIGRLLFEVALGDKRGRGFVAPLPPDGMTMRTEIVFNDIPVEIANANAELDIWFTDEGGHQWHRPYAGQLKQEAPPIGPWGLNLKVRRPQKNLETRVG